MKEIFCISNNLEPEYCDILMDSILDPQLGQVFSCTDVFSLERPYTFVRLMTLRMIAFTAIKERS